MLADGPHRPLLEQMGKWKAEREKIRTGIISTKARLRQARMLANITEHEVTAIPERLAKDMPTLNGENLKDFIGSMVQRITLYVDDLSCRINCEIPATAGEFMASPQACVSAPPVPHCLIWGGLAALHAPRRGPAPAGRATYA